MVIMGMTNRLPAMIDLAFELRFIRNHGLGHWADCTVSDFRHAVLQGLYDAGVPAPLLTEVRELRRLAYGISYCSKTPFRELLLTQPVATLRELDGDCRHYCFDD